jgi:phosphoenolpyruvate carboxykinase (GTP)
LMDIDPAAWHVEIDDIGKYLESYGTRMPQRLRERYQQVKQALG